MTDTGAFKKITQQDFTKIQLRTGTIKKVTAHGKYYSLLVDCAAADEDIRVIADLKAGYKMSELLGKQVIVACNLQHEKIDGLENEGMLLITHKNKKPVLITTDKNSPEGAAVGGLTNKEYFFQGR